MGIQLKTIFQNEWEGFCKTSHSPELKRKAVHDNVWKLLHCKTLWLGLQIYQCEDHKEIVKVVPCTCKSRFCPSCGYKANIVWLDELMKRVFPCDYQHLVFTLPYELRDLAKSNRRLVFNLMARSLTATINKFITCHKKLNYVPGIVAILHTFGKGLNWHPHFHVLVTAGGMRGNKWINNSYLSEKALKASYKAKLLKGLRKLYKQEKLIDAVGIHPGQSFLKLLSVIYESGWYVWIDNAKENGILAFQYIGRYCKRACISQNGITKYREGVSVTWKEKGKKKTPDICAYNRSPGDFIDLLIQHIPDTYNHQVRYYGIYSARNKATLHAKACKIFKREQMLSKVKTSLMSSWTYLLKLWHTVEPLTCPVCKKKLKLTGILFFNIGNVLDRDLMMNYEVKNYELVAKKADSS